jgi:hypothetical protein
LLRCVFQADINPTIVFGEVLGCEAKAGLQQGNKFGLQTTERGTLGFELEIVAHYQEEGVFVGAVALGLPPYTDWWALNSSLASGGGERLRTMLDDVITECASKDRQEQCRQSKLSALHPEVFASVNLAATVEGDVLSLRLTRQERGNVGNVEPEPVRMEA